MLFDVLDTMEWYIPLYPLMRQVIGIMDRSLPHDDEPGQYLVDGIKYEVLSYANGKDAEIQQAREDQMHIVLEGEELISLQEDKDPSVVLIATEGRFVIFKAGEYYKSSLQVGSSNVVKKVVFTLTQPQS
ncbi:MAG: hypothetical protein EOM15_01535 [Spirochaetia bacterium]|nr:hypothetical protein [Spirochaetia bacterium]